MIDRPDVIDLLTAVQASMLHRTRAAVEERPLLETMHHLVAYLRIAMADLHTEQLRVLYLNDQCRLIGDMVIGIGMLKAVSFDPREILRRALDLNATALILVHNHPGGLAEPSRCDREATAMLARAAKLFNVRVMDHLVMASGGHVSFRQLGLL